MIYPRKLRDYLWLKYEIKIKSGEILTKQFYFSFNLGKYMYTSIAQLV